MSILKQITKLESLDSCAVSDAMDALDLNGSVAGIKRQSTRQRIVGRVQTLKLCDKPPAGGSKQHLGARSIMAAKNTDIIVVEQLTGVECACWGGVLANAAQEKGVRGVIAEGPVRDVDEYDEIGFPVFSRSTTATTARGRIYEQSFNEPIRVGNIDVRPDDLVVADGSGIVFIPASHAENVIATAERIVEKERIMTLDVRSGKPVTEVMGTDYEKMLGTQD